MFKNKLVIMLALLCFAVPMTTTADDTAIYGTTSLEVQPNVLIILDTSGSMKFNKDVGNVEYDPLTTYTSSTPPSKGRNSVWQYNGTTTAGLTKWTLYANDIATSPIKCANTIDLLTNKFGYAFSAPIKADCTGPVNHFKLGNFMNYETSAMSPEYRYIVAQRAISNLLSSAEAKNKRFGLMVFNSSGTWAGQGGHIVKPCGSGNDAIKGAVDIMTALSFEGGTPLSETLAEAGLYFGGWAPWYNSTNSVSGIIANSKYISPIQEVCQKNYIILITDGEPSGDDDSRLYNTIYMNKRKIRDYDADGEDFIVGTNLAQNLTLPAASVIKDSAGGTKFLNDIASFLKEEDVSPLGTGTGFVKQNVFTYTIGLTSDQDLLASTAQKGGGSYYYASNISSLTAALTATLNGISESSAVFLAPSVPVNRTSKLGQSNWIYLAFFKPQTTGEWLGNIKKFALGKNGKIYGRDADGNVNTSVNVVDETGIIDDTACSFWTKNCNDGNDATKGGLGERLLLRLVARNIYYYSGIETSLTHASNQFSKSNPNLPTDFTDTVITDVINFTDNWKIGAIIHSEPNVVHYSNSDSAIFVGANDGMLHCFDDANGDELWGFIPPGQKTNLINNISNAGHEYYVDGSPVVTYGDVLISGTQHYPPKYMIFGERRGGNNYYVLDISDRFNPQWRYQIPYDILGTTDEPLGQSWCKPEVCTMATRTETIAGHTLPGGLTEVFLIGGGYDSANQDKPCTTTTDCPADTDTYGKAIFAANTGATSAAMALRNNDTPSLPLFKVTDQTEITGSPLTNCIVDIKASSTYTFNNIDITTRIYAGDLGGKVFVFADDLKIEPVNAIRTSLSKIPDGTFRIKLCLFSAPGKKILYAPSVSRITNSFNEYVVFGTGDREHPKNTTVQNGIYAVKNNWLNKTPYTEADLTNLTDIVNNNNEADLSSSHGWYINFTDPGEKMISAPIITQGYIYFTTYVPKSATASPDPCEGAGAEGVSYLWTLKLINGKPPVPGTNDDPPRKQVAVMAQPTKSDDYIFTPAPEPIPKKINTNYFFWRQR